MNKLIDLTDPFFAPVWIRVVIVLITAVWGLIELSASATFWGALFLGISAFCAWQFATIDYSVGPEE